MGLNRGWALSLLIVGLMASMSWMPVLTNTQETEAMDDQHATVSNTVQVTDRFATSAGFTHTNLTASPSTGLTELERPPVSWTATTGMGLMAMRTGACSAYLPSTNEVYLIGGRVDVDPSQTGDEGSTKSVEIFDMVNKSWVPSVEEMEEEQQYHGCAVVGDKIYAIETTIRFQARPLKQPVWSKSTTQVQETGATAEHARQSIGRPCRR